MAAEIFAHLLFQAVLGLKHDIYRVAFRQTEWLMSVTNQLTKNIAHQPISGYATASNHNVNTLGLSAVKPFSM